MAHKNDCPYCAARARNGWAGLIFECGTDIRKVNLSGPSIHKDCYKRQIEQLRLELCACYNVIPGPEKITQLPTFIHPGSVSNTIHAFVTQQQSKLKQLKHVSKIGLDEFTYGDTPLTDFAYSSRSLSMHDMVKVMKKLERKLKSLTDLIP